MYMIFMKLFVFVWYIILEFFGECKFFFFENGIEIFLCFVDFFFIEVEFVFFVFCNVCVYIIGILFNLIKVFFKLWYKVVVMLLFNILFNDDFWGCLCFFKNIKGVLNIKKN